MQFIQIAHTDQKNDIPQCTVTAEAREYLSKLHDPIAVVCGAGPFRCHKSYLLSQILDPQTREFSISPSVRPHTRGLWIARKFIENTNILLMDTEGLNAPDSTEALDTNILAFAIILSCKVMFSSKGRIDSTAFDSLQSATIVARWLSDEAQQAGSDMLASKPELLWVLRDFGLQLDDANKKPITPNQYLENVLNSANPELQASLKHLFVSRSCIPMAYPVNNDSELEDMLPRNLNNAFKRDLQLVTSAVLRSTPKKISGQGISGPVLLAMADTLCAILSKGGAPKLAPMWKTTQDAAAAEMRRRIVLSFQKNLQDQFTPDPKLLFWSAAELSKQMLHALQVWSTKQSMCQPADAVALVEECWSVFATTNSTKVENWKTQLLKNIPTNEVAHLLPKEVQDAITPIYEKVSALEQDVVNLKQQVEDAQSLASHSESTLINEEDLRTTKQDLHRTQAELEETRAIYDTFRTAILAKQKELREEMAEHKAEQEGFLEKEAHWKQEVAQLTKKCEEAVQETKTLHAECVNLRASAKETTTQVAAETRKRTASEANLRKLEQEVGFLKHNKLTSDTNLVNLTSENMRLKTDNFKLQCLSDMRNA